jgi:hypothetical protein
MVGFGYGFATFIGTWGGYWAFVFFIMRHAPHHRFVGWPVLAFVLLNLCILIGSFFLSIEAGRRAEELSKDPELPYSALFEGVGMLFAITGALACVIYVAAAAAFILAAYAMMVALGFWAIALFLIGVSSR